MGNSPFDFLKLEVGWDSYDGLVPNLKTIETAAALGNELQSYFSSPPWYVPCSDGSIQVEWHCDGKDVEMWIGAHG